MKAGALLAAIAWMFAVAVMREHWLSAWGRGIRRAAGRQTLHEIAEDAGAFAGQDEPGAFGRHDQWIQIP